MAAKDAFERWAVPLRSVPVKCRMVPWVGRGGEGGDPHIAHRADEFWAEPASFGIGIAATLWLLLGCLVLVPLVSAQSYSIRGDRIVVNTRKHWSGWRFPQDIVEVTDEGTVTPRRIRKQINAVRDAEAFSYGDGERGGVKRAGSNLLDVPNIIDGDPETFWEPDRDDPLKDWWVEIDLGRAVVANRMVLRFVEEGEGDPFRQFRVLVSGGERAFSGSETMGFTVVYETRGINQGQRVFEFVPTPRWGGAEGWTGAPMQYVRIVVMDSQRDKGEQMSREAYGALPSEEKGAIEYYVKGHKPGMEFLLDSKEEYDALSAERKGSVRYYRREIPRLADVDVWCDGDNIMLGTLARGGSVEAIGFNPGPPCADGLLTTVFQATIYSELTRRGLLNVDLGTSFWVDSYRIVTTETHGRASTFPGYEILESDGSKAPDGTLIWKKLSPKARQQNLARAHYFLDRFERHKVRYLRFKNIDTTGKLAGDIYNLGLIAEFQIYGEGYIPEVTMNSGLIDLGGWRNLISFEWEADAPPGTAIRLRTRTGDELREEQHFFNAGGEEVTERAYRRLPGYRKGDIVIERLPGSDWSNWSRYYRVPGDRILSPSPRKYMMIEAELRSEDPDLFPALRSIAIPFSRPLVKETIGEIAPHIKVDPGEPRTFEFFLSPRFGPTDPGFDQILLTSPEGVDIALVDLSLGTETDFLDFTTEDFLPDGTGAFLSASGDRLAVVRDGPDSLWVRLPKHIGIGALDLLRLRFRSIIFLNNTLFEASLGHSSDPDIWQMIDAGDATPFTSSRGMMISLPIERRIVQAVEISPNPFTPNGDGVNDRLTIAFSILKINTPRFLRVSIHTLSGRRVREIPAETTYGSGRYEIVWSGEEDSGEIVTPGLYLCRISVDADFASAEDITVDRVISVVY